MIRKIIFTLFISLLPVSYAHGGDKVDWDWWHTLDETSKQVFLAGFVSGRQVGLVDGDNNGFRGGVNATLDVIGWKIISDEALQEILNGRIETLASYKLYKKYQAPERPDRVIDRFIETYPLCKTRYFGHVLSDLIDTWQINSEKTYKEIGERCGAQSK